MVFSADFKNQRRDARYKAEFLAQISIGSQLTLNGHLKDLSLKSAFIVLKNSVYMQMNDEVGFSIQPTPGDEEHVIKGIARISRIVVGDGLAIYFTKMDDVSMTLLKGLVKAFEQD